MSVACQMMQCGIKYNSFVRDESSKWCFVSNDCPEVHFLGKVAVLKREYDRLVLSATVDVVETMKVCSVGEQGSDHLFRLDLQYYNSSCPRFFVVWTFW